MKIKNIYIAPVAYSKSVTYSGCTTPYFFDDEIIKKVSFESLRYALVQIKNDQLGNLVALDLNTKDIYMLDLPNASGKIFIMKNSLVPLKKIYPNEKKNLAKRKILKIGNIKINELNKKKKEN